MQSFFKQFPCNASAVLDVFTISLYNDNVIGKKLILTRISNCLPVDQLIVLRYFLFSTIDFEHTSMPFEIFEGNGFKQP